MGPVHEPSLLNGVVNPWQCKSGIQCGENGRWTSHDSSRHNTQLLDDSASHPPLRGHQHHHQLAPVGWPAADMRSPMKNNSPEKNCSKCTTFAEWLTGQHWAVCHTITHHRRAEGLCAIRNEGHCACVAIHSIPRGKEKTKRNPTTRWEVPRSSPRWAGNLDREVTPEPTQQDAVNCTVKKGDSARGTEHYMCQGHLTFNSARGTKHLKCHRHIGQLWQPEPVFGSGQVR